jgi:hypothetical protein
MPEEQPVRLQIDVNDKEIGLYTQVVKFDNLKSLLNYLQVVLNEKKK